jgi:hypothetical protein
MHAVAGGDSLGLGDLLALGRGQIGLELRFSGLKQIAQMGGRTNIAGQERGFVPDVEYVREVCRGSVGGCSEPSSVCVTVRFR